MAKELSEFEKAFKAARKEQGAGGTFEFKGKKYSTNTAEDVAKKRRSQDESDATERLRGMSPRMKAKGIEAEEPKLGPVRRPTFEESRKRPTNIRWSGSTKKEDVEANMPTGQPSFPDLPKGLKKGGKVTKKPQVKKYARGGGIESRGKTKGRFV